MARWVDRRLSWRISLRLARTAITPNQVTLGNTALGLLSAWLFSFPAYWPRLIAALMFLVSVTFDGVDGELARLKMTESPWGARLDVMTDNLVHVAIFAGIMTGCYRASGSRAYIYLLAILLVLGLGFYPLGAGPASRGKGRGVHRSSETGERGGFCFLVVVSGLLAWLVFFPWRGGWHSSFLAFVGGGAPPPRAGGGASRTGAPHKRGGEKGV